MNEGGLKLSMISPTQFIPGWSAIAAVAGWFAGWRAGETVAMQTPEIIVWWQQPAVISALVVALFMILGKLLDKYYDSKDKKIKRDDELHQKEVEFWKTQLNIKHLSEFESRQRAHRFGNEVNRLHSHIYDCHRLLAEKGAPIPDFKLKFYEELMSGLEDEVDKFKQSLAERLDEAIHKTGT